MNISGTPPSGEPPFWAPGTPIMWRYGDPDRPHWGSPMTVAQDDADGLVAWLPAGTPVLKVARADGLDFRGDPSTMFTAEREQAVGTWEEYDVLRIAPTGKPCPTRRGVADPRAFPEVAGTSYEPWKRVHGSYDVARGRLREGYELDAAESESSVSWAVLSLSLRV